MSIPDIAALKTAISSPREYQVINIPSVVSVLGRWYDLWVPQVPAGVAPTSAVAPTRTTAGALGQQNPSAALNIVAARFNVMNPGLYLVVDRLSHQGGLSGTSTSAQTTNLPTAALTRYTSGVGVMAGLTIYGQIGATGTQVSASYTDQGGTSGNATPTVAFGSTGYREANRMILLPLAAGDTGIQSVESVTLTATTGTVGNFGVTLFKPLAAIICDESNGVSVCDLITGKFGGGLPEVIDDAALCVLGFSVSTNLMGAGSVLFSES